MAIHTVRDYLTQDITTSNRQWIPGYLIGIFMRRILLYTYVGDTNYNLQTAGTYLLFTADSTPAAATPTFAAGTKAGINQGTGREFYVWVPPSVRVVGLTDIGRLLVLRSTANSTSNSGIYNITGFEILNLNVQTTTGTGVSPITVTTTTTSTLTTGQTVTIAGVTGNTNANGTWTITVLNGTQFTINATGNANYISGGTVVTNTYIVDYRTMGATGLPPQEPFDSMNWYLYEKDAVAPLSGAANTSTAAQYRGSGNSTTPRVIMQSPHALGWQVRLCHETLNDYSAGISQGNGNCAAITCMPGFGGNGSGDFPTAGQHLHTAMYYDSSSYALYAGGTPGFGDDSSVSGGNLNIQSRITIVGDDTGQGVVIFSRREFDPTNPRPFMCAFGLPENEPTPLPVNNAARLFVIGSGQSTSPGNSFGNFLNSITWSAGNIAANALNQGISQTQGGIPCTACPALWTYLGGSAQFGSPIFDGSAADSPWTNSTELFTVDIAVGTATGWTSTGISFPLEPRIIGTIPHLRAGRANFGEFALTTDPSHAWQHMRNGVFVTWSGPQVIP